MNLDYLPFDFSDEESGAGSFDAMASVPTDRVPALLAEVEAVLRWAHAEFGAPSAAEGAGEWDFALGAADETDEPLDVAYAAGPGAVVLAPVRGGRVTLTLTIGGSPAFCQAFRAAFPASDD